MRAIEAVVQAASGKDGAGGLGILIDDDGLVILNSRNPSWLLRPIVPLDPSHEAALAKSLKWGRGSAPQSIDAPDLAQAIGVRDNVSLSIAVDGAQYDALARRSARAAGPTSPRAGRAIRRAGARLCTQWSRGVPGGGTVGGGLLGCRIRRGTIAMHSPGLPNRTLLRAPEHSALDPATRKVQGRRPPGRPRSVQGDQRQPGPRGRMSC